MINIDDFPPILRMGITVDEEYFIAKKLYSLIKDIRSDKVLDVAPGNVLIPIFLSLNLNKEIFAVDDWKYFPKSEAEKLVKKYNADVKLFDGLPTIPFSDSSFDLVYSVMYLYNLRKESLKNAITELERVLKSGGSLVLVDTILVRGKVRKELEERKFKLVGYEEANALFFSLWKKER